MRLILSQEDTYLFERLIETERRNNVILSKYSDLLNFNERRVTPADVNEIMSSCEVDEKTAVCAVLSSLMGIDGDNKDGKIYTRYYLPSSVSVHGASEYASDEYYKNIEIPRVTEGTWELRRMAYTPYQAFLRDDVMLMPDFTEIPLLGFFRERFAYPAVLENGIEWMCVTPNEIETLREPIKRAHGKVLTLGLGLGYFAYMAAIKPEVTSVTVIERDKNVISLFKNRILPQFTCKDKIEVTEHDAYDYTEKVMSDGEYDYVLADIWHDAGDGFDMYLRLKKASARTPSSEWDYWIERSLLSRVRFIVFGMLLDSFNNPSEHTKDRKIIESYSEIKRLLSDEALRQTALNIKVSQ